MTVQSEIARLQAAKTDIMAALVEKGVDVTGKNLVDVPDLIDSISGGGPSKFKSLVYGNTNFGYYPNNLNFVGYDNDSPFTEQPSEWTGCPYITNAYEQSIPELVEYCGYDFTIEFWLKIESLGSQKASPIGIVRYTGNMWQLCACATFEGYAEIWTNDSLHPLYVAKKINDNKWHHIAVTKSNNIAYIYVDGAKSTGYELTYGNNFNAFTLLYSSENGTRPTIRVTQFCFEEGVKYTDSFTPSKRAYILDT